MIATTIISSIRVKPCWAVRFMMQISFVDNARPHRDGSTRQPGCRSDCDELTPD